MNDLSIPRTVRPPSFEYRFHESRHEKLFCEERDLETIAEKYGTPLYVYSSKMLRERMRQFTAAFESVPHTVCYSVKANSNLTILRMLADEGAGFDVVSAGEIYRVINSAPASIGRIVYSGVGKTVPEMELALNAGILLFNIESMSELKMLAQTASRLQKRAAIAVRVNPDVSAKTHPYISTGLHEHKFGVAISDAKPLYAEAAQYKYLETAGVSVHIGSQITDVSSFGEALQRVAELARQLRGMGHNIRYVDAGGGLGIPYQDESTSFGQHVSEYATAILEPLRDLDVHLLLEPGRSIIGPAGVLLTRVIYRKRNNGKRFLIVDAAMNDLIRPSLYGAHHEIVPLLRANSATERTDVVGPICETGDFFARNRELPVVEEGEFLAILDAGAYGASLGSTYNSRGRPAEVLVDGDTARIIRRRETAQDQVLLEQESEWA